MVFKLVCALYQAAGIEGKEALSLLEYTAIATVADVMELIRREQDPCKIRVEGAETHEKSGTTGVVKSAGSAG